MDQEIVRSILEFVDSPEMDPSIDEKICWNPEKIPEMNFLFLVNLRPILSIGIRYLVILILLSCIKI